MCGDIASAINVHSDVFAIAVTIDHDAGDPEFADWIQVTPSSAAPVVDCRPPDAAGFTNR